MVGGSENGKFSLVHTFYTENILTRVGKWFEKVGKHAYLRNV